ncbi:MAG: MFS transporter [Porphyrobacter sp.]|nr:MFS transporter [Porphyrobacter sp.]
MKLQGEFRAGWPVVAAAALGIGLGISPLPFYTIDVMVAPLGEEFGWSRGDVFAAVAIYSLCSLITAPLAGMMADRIGARKVAIASLIAFGLSMMALSLNTGSFALYLALWAVVAVCGAGTLPVVLTRPVNSWFNERRGLALGIALITTGVFGALAKAFAQGLVDQFGWREAYIGLGCLPLTIALPYVLLSLRDIDDPPYAGSIWEKRKPLLLGLSLAGGAFLMWYAIQFFAPLLATQGWQLQFVIAFAFMAMIGGLLLFALLVPFNLDNNTLPTLAEGHVVPGLTLPQALRTWRFWLLAICFVPIACAIGAMLPSIVPLLGSKGFSTGEAVSLATLTGLAVFLGRLVGGYMIDRFWAPAVAFVFLGGPAGALLLLIGDVTSTEAAVAILMIGFGAGVEFDFLAFMVSKYFGLRSYSSIYGALYAFFAVGSGLGPKLVNDMADAQGWDATVQVTAIALFVSTIPLLALGRYQKFD